MRTGMGAAIAAWIFCTGILLAGIETNAQSMPKDSAPRVGPNIELWVHQFNQMGISTFVIDGFTGRGLTTVSPNQALLGRLNLIVDIYRSLDILAKHARVDP